MSKETDVTENRQRGIGGSDIAAIMGFSPFVKRFDLLQYKAEFEENKFHGNEYTRYGQKLEPVIRAYINEQYDMDFEPDYMERDTDQPLSLYYHSDGHSETCHATLEIKTTSKIARIFDAQDKGIDFDDYEFDFYRLYYSQLFYGGWMHNDESVWLAVYERPDDLSEEFDPSRLFISTWSMNDHKDFQQRIQDEIKDFRADYDFLLLHPWVEEAELPSRNALAAIANNYFEIGGTQIPAGWLLQNEKALADAAKSLKAQLLEQMETHNIKTCSFDDLGLTATYVAQGADTVVQKFDEKRFMEEHRDLYREYTTENVKRGKAAYVTTRVVKGA